MVIMSMLCLIICIIVVFIADQDNHVAKAFAVVGIIANTLSIVNLIK